MKHLLKNVRKLCALVISGIFVMSMSTTVFAVGNTIDTEEEIANVLSRINAEYGTNIHVLSESELIKYGLTDTTPMSNAYANVELEETLRYLAEVEIPRLKRLTQEANAATENLEPTGINITDNIETNGLKASSDPITAKKKIEYAEAVLKAYETKDYYGNTIWGNVVEAYTLANKDAEKFFIGDETKTYYADGRRTIVWKSTGQYIANINGAQLGLDTGTQYTEFYIGDYCS